MQTCFDANCDVIEIGVDEAGRGPLFGRVYVGVVVLPKGENTVFHHDWMKDSKKFHSKKKITQVAEYIKANSIAWAVEFEDECVIDEINILQATQKAMHKGIRRVLEQLKEKNGNVDVEKEVLLLVDGNYFNPMEEIPANNVMKIEGGDNTFTAIAAASILAKVSRDQYIEELCGEHPELTEKYKIDRNKGYGSKQHLDAIRSFGITPWHRKTFGICKQFV